MWFENVVIILTWFVTLLICLKLYVKNKKSIDIIISCASFFAVIIYFSKAILNIEKNNIALIAILVFMYIIPLIRIFTLKYKFSLKNKLILIIAKFYYNMGRYDISNRLFMYLVKNNKAELTANTYCILGHSLRKEKMYNEARDMLFKAIELDKNNSEIYYELGLTLSSSNNKDTAIVMFSNALKINKEFKEAKVALAITYSEIERYNEAVSLYEELINGDMADEEVWYNLANLYYYKLNNTNKAEEAYNNAIEYNNKLYAAWFGLGVLNYLKGDYNQSINDLEIARKDEYFKCRAEYNLAKNYIALKENEKAIKILNKVVLSDDTYKEKIKDEIIFKEILVDVLK